ncbi:1,2-phenylacetyl-CoA epoxidase subunit PaaC [Asticcacaulis sp. AC402]|uniref:1,2-phenylacetyl-CoA epoxidase subunit PaaC n=1 Tax=Asticcacaulis sp. AC402 TaxID=1282361 RepID=UPI0003C3B8B9|nr:1,2-phenylacetyl-CoA epoxidase subunit PaaC [Asticcacaulis sp. AC402]ESQ75070.1 phenylacetate-CoA oxygenase [Asticcacaulis sp. AC402]
MRDPLFDYTLRLGDDALILGQKLSTWCGHAPCLEVDLGLSSLALDLVGQGTDWLELAGRVEGAGRDADALAFKRTADQFQNCLLVEQANGDFAQTLARQFLFSNWQYLMLEALSAAADKQIAGIAGRSVRDVAYHVDFSRDWMIRLGDGACLSHQRLVKSLEMMSRYVDELFFMDEVDEAMQSRGVGVDKATLRPDYDARIAAVLDEAGLTVPQPQTPLIGKRRVHGDDVRQLEEMQFNTRNGDVRWGF